MSGCSQHFWGLLSTSSTSGILMPVNTSTLKLLNSCHTRFFLDGRLLLWAEIHYKQLDWIVQFQSNLIFSSTMCPICRYRSFYVSCHSLTQFTSWPEKLKTLSCNGIYCDVHYVEKTANLIRDISLLVVQLLHFSLLGGQ